MSNRFKNFFNSSMALPPQPTLANVLLSGLGGFFAISVIALAADSVSYTHLTLPTIYSV